jgi:hypothetical protein
MTKKILKWFIYDTPPQELVQYYGIISEVLILSLNPC